MSDKMPINNGRLRKSTVALYSDELRYNIIQEVFKRPALWDNTNHETASVFQRKEFFQEISNNLKLIDNTLTATVVEKQWKNLKDTFNKVKKKTIYDENGKIILPKWRFYSAMIFIDQNNSVENNKPNTSLNKSNINRLVRKRKSKPTFLSDESFIPKKIFKSNFITNNNNNDSCTNTNTNNNNNNTEKFLLNSTDNLHLSNATTINNNCDDNNDSFDDETYDRFWGIWHK